ncbi:MBL fold metallo-hydrolase [Erythrobacter rubeus]|uniref:MBL fold metallo-hydrolase n=1 Tax=Erythrobacter rubeus TaxID=2760803 RepID=A0ABR8KNB8_9SPHN|nr:MBL fold metallo-hydrolase [Erythrobacter rubeus]MBD2842132.1 MBL fold metallo-hydrolase [Erythrobacter rubeus]
MSNPVVTSFFDQATKNVSHIVADPDTRQCAIIDPLLDYDQSSGRTSTESSNAIIEYVKSQGLSVAWIIDTHIHADHLSAAQRIKAELGGRLGIGGHISEVQRVFSEVFNTGSCFIPDGSQFDHLFRDGETYQVGNIEARAIHTPGHTPACMTHAIGDAAFVGDTLFMPDYGTARCDFPGGDARTLYRSIKRIFALPDQTRIFLNHDYLPAGRTEYRWETTVAEQRRENIHVREGISEDDFVAMRTERDAALAMPNLMIPSVQVNMRAGSFPPAESNGVAYLKVPVDAL